ncbi:hypothetical protein [Deinococcus ruber]|uniref:Uncharacterized protein n=1 Tax=Deinococcus ruber TaxID=1848197 RepID=A0A918BWV1_9DEIO|nr:hypothetical protein [Deinococcus ruber]GGQ92994.1 hypothetical protein GCM10008957_01200 [Deinococcus ruber]
MHSKSPSSPPRWALVAVAAVWTLLLLVCVLNVVRIMQSGNRATLTLTLILLVGLSISARVVWRPFRRP